MKTGASFTRIEEEVRRFWHRAGVPEAVARQRAGAQSGVIHQQPLAAAGQDWTDQVRLLAYADLMARYRTMLGLSTQHQAGWACHGLGLEVEVERSWVHERPDMARFNAACRSVALEGIRQGEILAAELGLWLDAEYATLSPQAMGAVWRTFRRLWDQHRVRREQRIAPFCPRCATTLSDVEASRRTQEIEGPSIWVGLPWDGEPGAFLVTGTNNPWMLVGLVGLALHPKANYVLAEPAQQESVSVARLLLSEAALERSPPGEYWLLRRVPAKALGGTGYRPLFTFPQLEGGAGRIILSEQVPLDVGTGVVPLTPAFDSFSLSLARAHGLPIPRSLDSRGNLNETVTPWRGLSPIDAEPYLVEDLRARGLLLRKEPAQRIVGHCPYCETPLLPLARDCWLVETGRQTWIVGRDRPWGTPLPVWVCADCGQQSCVAGIDDLAYRTGLDVDEENLHRPDVDQLSFICQACGGAMRRVPEVFDAAFEAAVLPWALASGGSDQPPLGSLAIGLGEQGKAWLAQMAALMGEQPTLEPGIVVPEAQAEGTWEREAATPADALRWAAYTGTTAAGAERSFLRSLWALAAGTGDIPQKPAVVDPKILDGWLKARVGQIVTAVTKALDAGLPRQAVALLAGLVDDMAGWYLPHRHAVGSEVGQAIARLAAPFVPHLAEALHRRFGGPASASVHLSAWQSIATGWEDEALLAQMAAVQRLVAAGEMARAEAGVDTQAVLPQAIAYLLPGSPLDATALHPFQGLLEEALRADRVRLVSNMPGQVRFELRLAHDRVASRTAQAGAIDATLQALDAESSAAIAFQLRDGFSVSVKTPEHAVTLLPDEVIVRAVAQPGWVVAMEDACCVALETG